MKFDVTIGIPVFRSESYIRRTLDSALVQTYPSIEFLLIDDAGGDGSLTIMQEIQNTHPRGNAIRIISHDKNLGVSASRNQIIDEAQGQYLYFMDSDDLIAENTIEILMQNATQYDAEIVFGSYEKIETSGECMVYQYPSLQLLEKDKLAEFAYRKYGGIQASACNYLVKTSILRDNNLRFIDTNYWEDFVFTFDLVTYISRAVLLPEVTYFYYCRENSLSHYQRRKQISKDEIVQNIRTIDYLKKESSLWHDKAYYPNRCYIVMMTDIYMACSILKHRSDIVPSFSNQEIKALLSHPATSRQIYSFRQYRLNNLILFLLEKLSPSLCVAAIWMIGKAKKLL
jgi:glycosyltransferase involved in cell wall biosynthesis